MSTAPERIRVGVADMAVTNGTAPIVTSGLGSCVAVAVHDGNGIAGLLHAMLPRAPDESAPPPKYVDTGIEAMIAEMTAIGSRKPNLVAKLAGGSSMLDLGNEEPIGDKNVSAAKELLKTKGIELVAENTGGDSGRSVSFDPETGIMRIERVNAKTIDL
ncbi:MAG: chemotaxis protein CheD [Halodesulfurarchaeum sp.]